MDDDSGPSTGCLNAEVSRACKHACADFRVAIAEDALGQCAVDALAHELESTYSMPTWADAVGCALKFLYLKIDSLTVNMHRGQEA
ncbi:MAG: hypothetical protein IPJ36_16865 [Simplicispira sp.]|nr:hypothetical protein [Simplicispira sp.]